MPEWKTQLIDRNGCWCKSISFPLLISRNGFLDMECEWLPEWCVRTCRDMPFSSLKLVIYCAEVSVNSLLGRLSGDSCSDNGRERLELSVACFVAILWEPQSSDQIKVMKTSRCLTIFIVLCAKVMIFLFAYLIPKILWICNDNLQPLLAITAAVHSWRLRWRSSASVQ